MIDFLSAHIVVVVAIVWLGAIGFVGGLMTEVGAWYESLRFPRIRPPNWLFGPAWTTIYVFIGIGGVKTWDAADASQRPVFLTLLAVNTVLNVLWSPLFFKLRRPDWALAELVAFWLSIAAIVADAYTIRPDAAPWFAVYWLWVTFAGWLNWRIVELNRPFGGRAA